MKFEFERKRREGGAQGESLGQSSGSFKKSCFIASWQVHKNLGYKCRASPATSYLSGVIRSHFFETATDEDATVTVGQLDVRSSSKNHYFFINSKEIVRSITVFVSSRVAYLKTSCQEEQNSYQHRA